MAVPGIGLCSRDTDLGAVEPQGAELAYARHGGHLRGDVLHPAESLCLPERHSSPSPFLGRTKPFHRLVTGRALPLGLEMFLRLSLSPRSWQGPRSRAPAPRWVSPRTPE